MAVVADFVTVVRGVVDAVVNAVDVADDLTLSAQRPYYMRACGLGRYMYIPGMSQLTCLKYFYKTCRCYW